MRKKISRYINKDDWEETPVTITPFLNGLCTPTGFKRKDGTLGNSLLPACIFEDRLKETFKKTKGYLPDIDLHRVHIRMPYLDNVTDTISNLYEKIPRPSNLESTSITIALVSKKTIDDMPFLEYGYNGKNLDSLRNRLLDGEIFNGLTGNLGYYMTENLVEGILEWTHNKRYHEDFHLKTIKSYLGFYMLRNREGKINSSFSSAHPAAVAVKKNGNIEVLPKIEITKYTVNILDRYFNVRDINLDKIANENVVVYTPGYRSVEVNNNIDNWKKYAPMVPVLNNDRINLFIANEGNGVYPVEKVVKVWNGKSPIPSFGAVLSFSLGYFYSLFENIDLTGENVNIVPEGNMNFEDYSQIYGGFVPAVINNHHLYDTVETSDIIFNLDKFGNARSPIAQAGRETNNFDPYIREPTGVFIETENHIGWVMFDGRHELSIGVSIADVGKILKMLERDNFFHERIKNAVFIDGGSAMKAYAVINTEDNLNLELLNRAAAGARNGPGNDKDGLNFYSMLKIPLNIRQ